MMRNLTTYLKGKNQTDEQESMKSYVKQSYGENSGHYKPSDDASDSKQHEVKKLGEGKLAAKNDENADAKIEVTKEDNRKIEEPTDGETIDTGSKHLKPESESTRRSCKNRRRASSEAETLEPWQHRLLERYL